jgi:radical SAM protein with 4Fe4S-binding SPASM domain
MFGKIFKLGKLELHKQYMEIEREQKHTLIDLFWECTLTCNAHCKHCGSSAEKKKYAGELTTQEAKDAFKQIAEDYDASKILINVTGGEPLTRADLCEVMEYATNELGFHWGMTSNGMLLDEEMIEKLRKANMETISISIDGLRDTHDEFRGTPGGYDLIIKNIKNLRKAGFVKHIQTTTVFNKSNIDQLEELYQTMLDLELDSWRLVSMDPIGRAKENDNLLLDGEDLKKIMEFIKKHNKNKKMRLDYGCPGFLGLDYEGVARPYFFFCRTGINVASILYNGDLFVCPNVPRIKRLIQGNIKTDRFSDVWENKYKEFRKKDRTKCDKCSNCEYWEYCLGGAFHTWNFDKNIQNKCVYNMMYKGE